MRHTNERYKKSPYYIETNNLIYGVQQEQDSDSLVSAIVVLSLRPKALKGKENNNPPIVLTKEGTP